MATVSYSNPVLKSLVTSEVSDYFSWLRMMDQINALTASGAGPFAAFESKFGLTPGTGSSVYADLNQVLAYLVNVNNVLQNYDQFA